MNKILHGDSLELLKSLDDNSVDNIVTDPPYGYSFMGKDWDKAVPSVELWKECLRVLQPGGFAFIMSAPRSDVHSEMVKRLEQSGFRVDFTPIYWTYATGFPKAMNVGKKTEEEKLDGSYSGYQPKPAVEVIIVVMKSLTEKTYVDQAMKNGKGVTWLDNVRIPFKGQNDTVEANSKGRFPANLLVQDDVLNDGKITKSTGGLGDINVETKFGQTSNRIQKPFNYQDEGSFSRYYDLDAWWKERIQDLPLNVQATYPFMIVPKASKSEKNKGLDALDEKQKVFNGQSLEPSKDMKGVEQKFTTLPSKNFHPTVKPISLMSYLVTLGSREGEVVLDPFVGSGTTCIAAKLLNRNYIGMEMNDEYVVIAEERIKSYEPEKKEHEFF